MAKGKQCGKIICVFSKALRPGAAVKNHGLKHDQHLNGEYATCISANFANSRCCVVIASSKEKQIIKAESLVPQLPEFQGFAAEVFGFCTGSL